MNVSAQTLKELKATKDQPGLQFYVAYAHTADISKHLWSLLEPSASDYSTAFNEVDGKSNAQYIKQKKAVASFSVATSSVLASIELLVELLYRVELDRRPGTDKAGLYFTIKNIVFQSLLLLDSIECPSFRHQNLRDSTNLDEEKKDYESYSHESTTSIFSVLQVNLALDKNLLSDVAKQVLRSIVQELIRRPSLCPRPSKSGSIIMELALTLGLTWSPAISISDANNHDNQLISQQQSQEGFLPYERLARTIPELVLSEHVHGPEDFLFKIPHIIIEHWFFYIEHIVLQNELHSKAEASKLLNVGSGALKLCTRILDLLQYMQLADFHPLRVALHGSSGFFSKAFFRIRHWIKNEFQSVCKHLDTMSIHVAPESNSSGHQYLCRLELFESSFRCFSFGHFLIAQRTLGSSSIGSAGKSFLKSFSPEYNQMKFLLHEFTSIKYDSMVGKGVQNIADYVENNTDDDDASSVSTLSHQLFLCPASDEVLHQLARSFQDRELERFAELFDHDNCFIQHPKSTLPYRNRNIRSYFQNITKRYNQISMFSIKKRVDDRNSAGSGELIQVSGGITAQLVGILFDGSQVDYNLHGSCLMHKETKKIMSLVLNGSPDIQFFKNKGDQRMYSWNEHFFSKKKLPRQPRISNEGMDVSYRRLLSPAEKMAYEINSVYDKAKSDGLTIVARSLVEGRLPTDEFIKGALQCVKNAHPLLNSHIELIDGKLTFISTPQDCLRTIPLEVQEDGIIDCEALMDTKFDCAEGDFLRVIISKNNGEVTQKLEGHGPLSMTVQGSFFELVTVIYHGICDAISVRELHHQIIREIATAMRGISPRTSGMQGLSPMPIPVSAASLVKKSLGERQAKQDFQVDGNFAATPSPPRKPLDQAPLSWSRGVASTPGGPECFSRAINHKFSAQKVRRMLDACKRNGTTMHGLISAAALIASSECGKATRRVLCSAVDLRRRVGLNRSELVYAVGGFDGSAAFEYNVDAEIDIWELARQVRSDIVDSVNSGRLFTTYLESMSGLLSAYKAGYLEGGTFGTIFLSNIGNETYNKRIGSFRWREFEYIYGQFIPGGPHYHITANTFDGRLFLNCLYVNNVVPDDVAQGFFDTVYLLCCHA